MKLRPYLLLLLLIFALATSSCGKSGPPARPDYCPALSPAPSNVMRSPQTEKRLREKLFRSAETPTTSSAPAKQ